MIEDCEQFIREVSVPTKIPFLNDMELFQAEKLEPLWQKMIEILGSDEVPPPFWAFAWVGGQGLAKYVLDNPEVVAGKSVLDFAAGCGMVAIAASKSKARKLRVCDIDPLSKIAMQLNADLNDVRYKIIDEMDFRKAPKGFDVILVGDVCYDPAISHQIIKWLRICAAAGIEVIMGDPGRAYMPTEGMEFLGEYIVPECHATEYTTSRRAQILRVMDVVGE